VYGDLKRSL